MSEQPEQLRVLHYVNRFFAGIGGEEQAGQPPELRREIQERLSLGPASDLAAMDRLSFQRLLAGRGIPIHYDVEEFEADVETLRGLGQLP